jgi:hypothetical protein
MKFYYDCFVRWIIKFGNPNLFLWDKPKLFPYPSGKFGGLSIGGKWKMRSSLEVSNQPG